MTRYRLVALLMATAVVSGLVASQVFSQHPAGKTEKTVEKKLDGKSVAVLDVKRLFKESRRFKTAMDKVTAEAQADQAQIKREEEKIKKQLAAIEKLPARSEERSQKEEQLNKLQAALRATKEVQKDAFIRKQTRIYHDIYQDIVARVEDYAKAHGTEIVIQARVDPADIGKPDTVLAQLNSSVIWFAAQADITSLILDQVDQKKDTTE
jgi:Skp family chaperone for outer membrane proteins